MYTKESTSEKPGEAQIKDRREMLRIKAKSLMEEAKIIRKEEARIWGPLQQEMHHHRVIALRLEARLTHAAYALVRGKDLKRVFSSGSVLHSSQYATPLHVERILKMTAKYGEPGANGRYAEVLAHFTRRELPKPQKREVAHR